MLGSRGAVTVATNMAGRGTDIKLEPQLAADGGLHVIVTQMHSFARVDRQLIGRCARCGDPGSFRIFVASDDPLPSSVSRLGLDAPFNVWQCQVAQLAIRFNRIWTSAQKKAGTSGSIVAMANVAGRQRCPKPDQGQQSTRSMFQSGRLNLCQLHLYGIHDGYH